MKTIVFLGPTLPVDEARQVLDAIYLPPVGQADLISALERFRPEAVAIVDGVFHQSLSIWHKEILFALSRGVAVYGASSMGALRAAELAELGMVGVGVVYRMYASSEVEDDDEVAVAHGTAETGYRAFSEPMVNIRVTLQAARDQGVLNDVSCGRLVTLAKAMPYPQRSYPALLAAAAQAGFPADLLAALRGFLAHGAIDVKRQDALELLTLLRGLDPARLPPRPETPFRGNHLFQALYDRDRSVYEGEHGVSLAQIATHAALHRPDFTALNTRALHRGLVLAFADLQGIQATPEEITAEMARFQTARGLHGPEELADWLSANDLSREDLELLVAKEALCRSLRHWICLIDFKVRNVRLLLDQLRLEGGYEACKREAICQDLLARAEDPSFPLSDADLPLEHLAREHLEAVPWDLDTALPQWSEEAGFLSREHLATELERAYLARRLASRLALRASAVDEDDRRESPEPTLADGEEA
jgi:hypothetical protein